MRRLRPAEALLLLAPLFILPAILFGMSGDRGYVYPSPPARMLKLTVLTPHQKAIQSEIGDGFRRWLYEREGLGVDITWAVQSGSTALRYIREQYAARPPTTAGTANRPTPIGVDVFFGAGIDPYEQLKEEQLLAAYSPPEGALAGIPADVGGFPLYDPDGCWFGTCITGFGIMINTAVMQRIPTLADVRIESWEDLADPRLLGFVASADPRTSSSAHTCFEILLQAYGFERGMQLAKQIGGNARAFANNSSEIPRLCAVGEAACGLTMDFYAYAQIDKVGEVIRFVLPEGNTLVNADAVGILKGAEGNLAAQRFVDFLLTEDAARLWMLRVGEPGGPLRDELTRGAIRPAVYEQSAGRTNVRENPFLTDYRLRFDSAKAGARWNLLNDLLGATLVDPHAELVAAMRAITRCADVALRQRAMERLNELPVTETEVEAMRQRWTDAEFRGNQKIAWTGFARRQYRDVIALLGGGQ